MTEFDAYYYDNKFYIGGRKEYALGEILTKFLSKNFKDLDYYLRRCRDYIVLLRHPEERSEAEKHHLKLNPITNFSRLEISA